MTKISELPDLHDFDTKFIDPINKDKTYRYNEEIKAWISDDGKNIVFIDESPTIEEIIAEIENKLYENSAVSEGEIRALINHIRENKPKE